MRGAFIIAGKDLRNFFFSPLFYIVAGVCSVIWWVFFALGLRSFIAQSAMAMYQQRGGDGIPLHFAVVYGFISMVNLIMILAVAAITMRLFTEEKRNRTFDLLLTAPVTSTEIVIGKLIAGTLTTWALVGVSAIYPLSLFAYGTIDAGPMFSSIIGLMLLCAGYVAVGMFASSVSSSAVVSVILALVLEMSLWFVGAIADGTSDPSSRSIIEHISVGGHFTDFMKGSPSIAGLVYFVSLVFFFSFLTRQVVESTRWR